MRFARVAVLIIMTAFSVIVTMVTKQTNIDRCEQREDEGLNEADEELHEVEDENETGAMEEIFATEDVTEKTDRKGEGANRDRENFDKPDDQKYERKDRIEPTRCFLLFRFITEEIPQNEFRTGDLEYDDRPCAEGDESESDCAVEIRIVRTDQGAGQVEVTINIMTPTHGAYTRNQSHPVVKQNEEEKRDEDRKRHRKGVFTDDRFQKVA